jgi:hypothetical protein
LRPVGRLHGFGVGLSPPFLLVRCPSCFQVTSILSGRWRVCFAQRDLPIPEAARFRPATSHRSSLMGSMPTAVSGTIDASSNASTDIASCESSRATHSSVRRRNCNACVPCIRSPSPARRTRCSNLSCGAADGWRSRPSWAVIDTLEHPTASVLLRQPPVKRRPPTASVHCGSPRRNRSLALYGRCGAGCGRC